MMKCVVTLKYEIEVLYFEVGEKSTKLESDFLKYVKNILKCLHSTFLFSYDIKSAIIITECQRKSWP